MRELNVFNDFVFQTNTKIIKSTFDNRFGFVISIIDVVMYIASTS